MEVKIIKSEEDYKNAVNYLEELGEDPTFKDNLELKGKFEVIEKLIELYDQKHYSIEKGNPIEIIRLKMQYLGLKQKDLIPAMGSKGVVSDVLNKKRKLSKKMIRELSKLINVSQEILNTEYELTPTKFKGVTKEIHTKEEIFTFPKRLWLQVETFSDNIFQRGAIMNVMTMANQ